MDCGAHVQLYVALAQDVEGSAAGEAGAFGIFSLGNLALNDVEKAAEPLEQVKRFFSDSKKPLTSQQEKQLSVIVDAAVQKMRESGADEASARRINAEYMRNLNGVLTVDQRGELQRHRTEQIMMRGGFPAMKLVLENANAPFTEDQERDDARCTMNSIVKSIN